VRSDSMGVTGEGRARGRRGPRPLMRRSRYALAVCSVLLLSVLVLPPIQSTGAPLGAKKAQIGSSSISIVVRDAKTGDSIPNFQWVVNLDNSHQNASLIPPASYSPVVATGETTDGSGKVEVSLPDTEAPNRGYLVSAFVNDGVGEKFPTDYKIGGAHFKMPDDDGQVVVELQPHPLPLATLKTYVFHDNRVVNGEPDIGFEDGLEGFHVTIDDRLGEVTTDWFGNPICTEYEDRNGNGKFDPGDYDSDGNPVPIPGTGGFCVTGPDGIATIPNLGPNKYEVQAIPPTGKGWIQTATIEGTLANDGWVEEGSTGLPTAADEAGFPAQVFLGFVRQCSFGDSSDDCLSEQADMPDKHGVIKGRIRSIVLDNEMKPIILGNPVSKPYIALTNIGGNDEQVWTGRGNPDGTFEIPNVPVGLYQMAIWDLPLDHVIQFVTVRVTKDDCVGDLGPCTVDMGDIGVPPWFGKMRGTVYIDTNENGIRDPGEASYPTQDLDTRFKDGTIQYATFADGNGNYVLPEVFELEHFAIAEVGYGRFKQTGAAAYETDKFGNPINYPWANDCKDANGDPVSPCSPGSPQRECTDAADWRTCEHGPVNQDLGLASLLQSEVTWAGTTNYFDWGKKPFGPGENGGIVGIAFYAMTRNELEARLQANEDYEPGIPGTRFNLYSPKLDANGDPMHDPDTGEILKDHLSAVYDADSFNDAYPADCIPRGSLGRTPGQVEPNGDPPGEPSIFRDCLELPSLLQQVKPGVFDGGYAFDADCFDPAGLAATDPNGDADGDGVPNRFDEDLLLNYDAGACPGIPNGQWVVQVDAPDGYRVVMEEDVNVFGGDAFEPGIQVPPPACAGPMHTVHVVDDPTDANFDPTDPSHTQGVYNPDFLATPEPGAPGGTGSPYEGKRMPLCTERLVEVQTGFNANSDFFMFTDVPQPGRIVGVLLDDLTLEFNPQSPLYGEKRGIPNAPVGIYDFSGKLITTVKTDENGYWEVLLPSTGTYNCPLPAGPCPGMYVVVGDDPGNIQNPNPNYDPNYQTLSLVFEVWPGNTTYADVATIPITGFVQDPDSGFQTPPRCDIPASTPDIRSVSQPYGHPGDSFTINGSGFGSSRGSGSASLGKTALTVNSWSDKQIDVTVPSGATPGPLQLTVANSSGATAPTGITFHVLGAGYDPPQIHVDGASGDDQTGDGSPGAPYNTIQKALDVASDGSLILVHPGNYNGKSIVHSNSKLQGYGPGATTLNGLYQGAGFTHSQFDEKVGSIPHDGPPVPWGQTITVLAKDGQYHSGYNPQIDGFMITGGRSDKTRGTSAFEGGGVYVNGFARYLEVSNNLVQSNGGKAGAGIIFGLPTQLEGLPDNQNDNVRVHDNRVLNNGAINLAGGIALFNGAENYEVDHNVVCGNYSAEYGAGISHWGLSPNGHIHDNQILFNYAFDEGGGIMVAGEPSKDPNKVSLGSGPVTIERNLIQGNVSNDDGGGIRLLNPVQGKVRIVNNMVVNNLATDVGGGISLDDALDVDIVNNTVAKNTSTATAEDADRNTCNPPPFGTCPHGAGLTSEGHSQALRDAIDRGDFDCDVVNCASDFSDPTLFNNIFWQNEAFYLDGSGDLFDGGLTSAGYIDFDVLAPANGQYDATFSDCTAPSIHCDSTGEGNIFGNPQVIQQVTTEFVALAFAGDPSFVTIIIKSKPSDPQGDYHLQVGSPAQDKGTSAVGDVNAPADDFDLESRPSGDAWDLGADEGRFTPTMHIGDLDGSRRNLSSTEWQATVKMLVVDAAGSPVTGSKVTGKWSVGVNRTRSCTTDGTGSCSVNSSALGKLGTPKAGFTVTGATHARLSYASGDNQDPDGDSNGSVIQVWAPTMNVGDLDGTARSISPTRWRATVNVLVLDASGKPVPGAKVTGKWSAGDTSGRTLSCITGGKTGRCLISSGRLLKSANLTVAFSVTSVTHASLSYLPGANRDPERDSNGTRIVIRGPRPLLSSMGRIR
jgi:IPT/TIG domain-containing protein/copper-binding protein NosD